MLLFLKIRTKAIGNPTYRELVYTLRIGESLDEAKQAADVMASRFGWDVIIMSTNKKEVLYKASATKAIGNPLGSKLWQEVESLPSEG